MVLPLILLTALGASAAAADVPAAPAPTAGSGLPAWSCAAVPVAASAPHPGSPSASAAPHGSTASSAATAPATAATPAPAHPVEPAPVPGGAQPPPLDEVTTHRAEQAADAYLRAQGELGGHADPEAEHALASAEVELLEAQTFLDLKLPFKAGERYLEAAKLISGIAADQRAALGGRLRKASASLTALSRRLLDEKAFDLGPPEPASPPAAH